jgi:hypothetical protein
MLGYSAGLMLVEDQYQRQVVLFKDKWIQTSLEKNKKLEFYDIPPAV